MPPSTLKKLLIASCVIGLLPSVIIALPADAAPRNNITVNSLEDDVADDGGCTLREAIIAANTNTSSGASSGECPAGTSGLDTIDFSVTGIITLTNKLPPITDALSVVCLSDSVTISGNDSWDIFYVISDVTANFINLSIVNGWDYSYGGGAITNFGNLTISSGRFEGNVAAETSYGGAIVNHGVLTITNSSFVSNTAYTGGAIHNEGMMTVVSSTFTSNSSTSSGYTGNYGGGAIEVRNGFVSITGTSFSNNTAATAGGIFVINGSLAVETSTFYSNSANYLGGGGIFGGGIVTVTNSTFLQNRALGGFGSGGGIVNAGYLLTIINSTFVENQAILGGGITGAHIDVANSTFWGNSASNGNGSAIYASGSTLVRNAVVANSSAGGNCSGTITDGGNNIDDGSTCGWGSTNGSMSNTNPRLGSLANNGGPTLTMALLPGSPAIDGVTISAPNACPSTDQRGVTRPIGARCDIGAFEAPIYPRYFFPFAVK